jgi:hypothetical protein
MDWRFLTVLITDLIGWSIILGVFLALCMLVTNSELWTGILACGMLFGVVLWVHFPSKKRP